MFSNISISDFGILFASILIAMSFHEAMHAFVGHALGDTTAQEQGRLTLNPLKHISLLTTILLPMGLILLGLPPIFAAKPVPFNPDRVRFEEFGAALIAAAGPFTNLVLAFIAAQILQLTPAASTGLSHALVIFMAVNIGLFVFNLIPFPPLDGSRILYAVAPEPLQKLMYAIEGMGLTGLVLFILILFPFISPLITHVSEGLYNFLLQH